MLTNSLAPIKRAGLFFGFMGAAVFALTLGSGLQETNPASSEAVAQAKVERQVPTDTRVAAVDPSQRAVGVTKRAIGSSQQAMLPRADGAVTR
jgi:predicted cobalt transporter CbtA